ILGFDLDLPLRRDLGDAREAAVERGVNREARLLLAVYAEAEVIGVAHLRRAQAAEGRVNVDVVHRAGGDLLRVLGWRGGERGAPGREEAHHRAVERRVLTRDVETEAVEESERRLPRPDRVAHLHGVGLHRVYVVQKRLERPRLRLR